MPVREGQPSVSSPAPPAAVRSGLTAEDADGFLARLEGRGPAVLGPLASEDAAALDALAVACARGGGAHELAVGEGLELLARGGDVRLGFSCIGDLARERLGLAAWQGRRLRRNAVALGKRPLLRAAVESGAVSARKAEVVLPVAVGADEAYWVERARVDTVRRLEAAVSCPEHVEEDWARIRLALPREQAEVVDAALGAAKVVLGPTAPLWKRLWALAAEFLSTHPSEPLGPVGAGWAAGARPAATAPPERGAGARPVPWSVVRAAEVVACSAGMVRAAGAAAVDGLRGAAGVPDGRDAPAPELLPANGIWVTRALTPDVVRECGLTEGGAASCSPEVKAPAPDPYDVLERLVRLVADRTAADERLGRACLLVKRFGVARQLGWSCFEEWCLERLGLAPSTVYQRMALERRMAALPELREALRSRRLSYEQARLVARVATPSDVAARIEDAAGKTCIALVRDLEAEERLQMCDAGELRAVVPEDVESLLSEAISAARLHSEHGLTPGEALVEIAWHFITTWAPEVIRLIKGADPVILRDAGLCQVPGCSRPAAHVHHLWFRSAGGPLEAWNELALCLPHHLLCVHRGSLLITGRAPRWLTFVLGEKEVAAAKARA